MLVIPFFLASVFIAISVVLCDFQDLLFANSAFIHLNSGGKNSAGRIAGLGVGDYTLEHLATP